jgi:hypothetical protein
MIADPDGFVAGLFGAPGGVRDFVSVGRSTELGQMKSDFRGRYPAASVEFVTREYRNYSVSGSKVNAHGAHAELP